jgi:hypothetical protein
MLHSCHLLDDRLICLYLHFFAFWTVYVVIYTMATLVHLRLKIELSKYTISLVLL